MTHLIKVRTYDKVMGKWIDTYINPEKIIMLSRLEDETEGILFMCYLPDIAIRLSDTSYYHIIHVYYGKEYNDDQG